jgi:hypothetical protein
MRPPPTPQPTHHPPRRLNQLLAEKSDLVRQLEAARCDAQGAAQQAEVAERERDEARQQVRLLPPPGWPRACRSPATPLAPQAPPACPAPAGPASGARPNLLRRCTCPGRAAGC